MSAADPILELRALAKTFRSREGSVSALVDVSLSIERGRTLAVVGESGSGKSTLAKVALALVEADAGSALWRGEPGSPPRDLFQLEPRELRALRREFGIVFQDPRSSLEPRLSVRRSVEEPLVVHELAAPSERTARVDELLRRVGLEPALAARFPHQFSLGQLQRLSIARALASRPKLLVLDEPTSALDLSIQAEILNLLVELQDERGLSYLFVSHDLGVVRHMANRTAVLSAGRIVEERATAELLEDPREPTTRSLVAAWRASSA